MSNYEGVTGEISMKSNHEVEWRIGNFLSYTSPQECFCSPDFCISGREWHMRIYPNGETEESSGWISLFLEMRNFFKSSMANVHFRLGVKTADGIIKGILKSTQVFDSSVYGFARFLSRSELHPPKVLTSGTLTLNCTLWTEEDLDTYGSLDALSRNFADMFISKRGCDATVKVVGEEFPVHKYILSARSPVFAAAFDIDMKEKATGIIEIEDFDSTVVREFLMYLYSCKVKDGPKNALELYRMADKYDVEDLKIHCVMLIMTSLTVENVLDAAVLGNQFNEYGLMIEIEKFFIENCKQIISSTKWDDEFLSENAAVANRLLKFMAKW